jgi:malate synthase
VRGLHLSQSGIFADGSLTSASLFDVALLAFRLDYDRLRHPLCIYIPKSESAEEALWWKALFDSIIQAKGWKPGSIRAMALVEAHPLPYQMEEFLFNLREYLVGLNLGRWDYMASLIHFNLNDPEWLLPDRNTIPLDVPFFQTVRTLLPDVCHKHGALAIGGMTALYPSREDPELNARALAVLERDKRNESSCLMDGSTNARISPTPTPTCVLRRTASERRPSTAREPPSERSSVTGTARSKAKARVCWTAIWKIWPRTASTG